MLYCTQKSKQAVDKKKCCVLSIEACRPSCSFLHFLFSFYFYTFLQYCLWYCSPIMFISTVCGHFFTDLISVLLTSFQPYQIFSLPYKTLFKVINLDPQIHLNLNPPQAQVNIPQFVLHWLDDNSNSFRNGRIIAVRRLYPYILTCKI